MSRLGWVLPHGGRNASLRGRPHSGARKRGEAAVGDAAASASAVCLSATYSLICLAAQRSGARNISAEYVCTRYAASALPQQRPQRDGLDCRLPLWLGAGRICRDDHQRSRVPVPRSMIILVSAAARRRSVSGAAGRCRYRPSGGWVLPCIGSTCRGVPDRGNAAAAITARCGGCAQHLCAGDVNATRSAAERCRARCCRSSFSSHAARDTPRVARRVYFRSARSHCAALVFLRSAKVFFLPVVPL
jgi:hypothetical protein